ncbi:hypothetical protein Tco_0644400, partial [Tanacetum coccineum]
CPEGTLPPANINQVQAVLIIRRTFHIIGLFKITLETYRGVKAHPDVYYRGQFKMEVRGVPGIPNDNVMAVETGMYENLLQDISQTAGASLPTFSTFRFQSKKQHGLPEVTKRMVMYYGGSSALSSNSYRKNATVGGFESSRGYGAKKEFYKLASTRPLPSVDKFNKLLDLVFDHLRDYPLSAMLFKQMCHIGLPVNNHTANIAFKS